MANPTHDAQPTAILLRDGAVIPYVSKDDLLVTSKGSCFDMVLTPFHFGRSGFHKSIFSSNQHLFFHSQVYIQRPARSTKHL